MNGHWSSSRHMEVIMLDVKRIRYNYEEVERLLCLRGKGDYGLYRVKDLDEKRRRHILKVEEMKQDQNKINKEIPRMKSSGEDTSEIFTKLRALSLEIKRLDGQVKALDDEISRVLLEIPNTLLPDTPVGRDESDNVVVRKWGVPRVFDFEIKGHWTLGSDLDILDFERATKITGTRFTILKGLGARMERALINFMLDLHTDIHHFHEIFPPFMVNRDAMMGTGQLPKFEEDMFHIPSKDYFLIPTAEVPVTNMYRNEILDEQELPIKHTAYTPCFRKEAGSAGKDTKGVIRQHQFNKVELVKFVRPENSSEALEELTNAAEEVLKRLELPYRVIRLCGGDVGFSAAKTYDIEVWLPSYNGYKEISSCSNFQDYQARRANIRFRESKTNSVRYVHTLNGSGLAVGRTLAAILENYQNEDGSISIPKALQGYMGNQTVIK